MCPPGLGPGWTVTGTADCCRAGERIKHTFEFLKRTFDCLQSLQIRLSQPLKPINIELKLNYFYVLKVLSKKLPSKFIGKKCVMRKCTGTVEGGH